MNKTKEIFKLLSVPIVFIVVYATVHLLWKIFDFPSYEELLVLVKEWFVIYGLGIVFTSALIEGFLLLGQYFPGGLIIFLGVISAGNDGLKAAQVIGVVSVAFFISYSLNYCAGKYGWYRLFSKFGLQGFIDKAKQKLQTRELSVIFLSYWEPNLASITATAAGILNMPFKKFSLYSGVAIVMWNALWGILVYKLGERALLMTGVSYALIIFVIWVSVLLFKKYVFEPIIKRKL